MRLSRHSGPSCEPMHLTEAKLHLRLAVDATDAVLYTSEDSVLSSMISAVRQIAEAETRKAIVLQTWDAFLDEWPECNEISLPLPPLRAVEFVRYTDSSGAIFDFTDFTVDIKSEPGRVVLNNSASWPSSNLAGNNPIQIRFKCGGLAPVSVSGDIITARGGLFSDGDMVSLSVSGGALPTGLSALTEYFVIDSSGDDFSLSETVGGAAIDLTGAGSGLLFIGEITPTTMAGMKLVLSDLYEERSDTMIGKSAGALPKTLPRAATHLFSMDADRTL